MDLNLKPHAKHQPGLRGHSMDEGFADTGDIHMFMGPNFKPVVRLKRGVIVSLAFYNSIKEYRNEKSSKS